MQKAGFIGTGVMGASMASHLLEAGYSLAVYNRTRSKAEPLLARGATWCDSPAKLVEQAQVVVTMLGYPEDVEQVYAGAEGLIPHLAAGTLLVDCTTSSPELARQLAQQCKEKEAGFVDAPVSGGDVGAREARLSIMAGGETSDFERSLPLLQLFGKNIVHHGEAGNGQIAKLANQVAIASTMMGVCEAIAFAQNSGLDADAVLRSISSGAAGSWSLSHLMPRALAGDFAPGFYVKHFVKDLRLALEWAQRSGQVLPGLQQAAQLYEQLLSSGRGDDGTQALYKLYRSGELN